MRRDGEVAIVLEKRREYLIAARKFSFGVDHELMKVLKDGRSFEARKASGEFDDEG